LQVLIARKEQLEQPRSWLLWRSVLGKVCHSALEWDAHPTWLNLAQGRKVGALSAAWICKGREPMTQNKKCPCKSRTGNEQVKPTRTE
jgi:hypothetical protein